MWHYARGVALAAQANSIESKLWRRTAIEAMEGTADFTLLKASGRPSTRCYTEPPYCYFWRCAAGGALI